MILSILIVVLGLAPVAGNDGEDPEPRILIAQRTGQGIIVDGVLNEADWGTAAIASDFLQYEPREGDMPSQRTEVRMMYGNNSVYIGAMMYDTEPDQIWQTLGRRDSENKADWFYVSIDGYLNRKEAFTFAVNAAGVQLDGITTRELNTSWNAVWDSAVRVTENGWIVEMRIPYSMLRFSEADEQAWGLNFRRLIPRTGETLEWALVRRNERQGGVVSQYGELQGLEQLQPRRNVQFTPYTVSRMLTHEGDPGKVDAYTEADMGADLKLGLSSNMTLDIAINPDFGQVDSDPAQLNLTAFETFNREQRPFFVEGSDAFSFSLDRGSNLLYTRRIGSSDPIIGATKLSGRTENGLSFGVLGATTGSQFNPTRYYGATRFRQEIGKYSSIGGIATIYDRRLADEGLRSLVGGADWDARLADNTYKVSGYAAATDRRFVDDRSLSSRGYALQMNGERIRGNWTYGATLNGIDDQFNPNDTGQLRQNNFIRLSTSLSHQFNDGQEIGPFQRASVRIYNFQSRTWVDGISRGAGVSISGNVTTKNYQDIEASIFGDYLFGGYDIYETRGLLPWAPPKELRFRASFETDSRRQWKIQPKIAYTPLQNDGKKLELDLEGDWDVSNRFSLAASIGIERENGVTAWASNESIKGSDGDWQIGETSDSPVDLSSGAYRPFSTSSSLTQILYRHSLYENTDAYYTSIFGQRDSRAVDLTLRGSVTFSPSLSLQVYGQVFAARGQYQNFSILSDPDTLVPIDSYPKRREFSSTSVQTNTVLRWEYRPGSTLFLVWTHVRVGDTAIDPFDATSSLRWDGGTFDQLPDAFGVFPENTFLIKLNYTFLR